MTELQNVPSRCATALEHRYDGLRFVVRWSLHFGSAAAEDSHSSDLEIEVRGSREDLSRHFFMSEADWSIVPPCGVSYSLPKVHVIHRLKNCWRLEIHERIRPKLGRGENPLHVMLFSLLKLTEPDLEQWMHAELQAWRDHRRGPDKAQASAAPKIHPGQTAKSRPVGRYQRQVTWNTVGNLIVPNWIQIKAQASVAREKGQL